MSRRLEIRSGEVYGRLTVLREVEPRMSGKQRQRCVECRCECGEVGIYRLYTLRNGNTRSCGCFSREVAGRGCVTHGCSSTPEYGIWSGMRRRCTNSRDAAWRNYGGRGISVCQRWEESFEAFLEDMGRRPSEKHSLDRIDVNGNYEPSNCRWATAKEQMRNTRVNYLVEHDGEVKCISEWAEQYDIAPNVLYSRLVKLGWTFEKAVGHYVHVRREIHPHYRVPMKERGAEWQREHERLEAKRIAKDREEIRVSGDKIAKIHRVDALEFKSRADAALVDGWTRGGAIWLALHELGAVHNSP
jgi:hypothetical protein